MSHEHMKVANNAGQNIEALLPGLDKPVEIRPQGTQDSVNGEAGKYAITTKDNKNIVQGSFAARRSVSIVVSINVVSSQT